MNRYASDWLQNLPGSHDLRVVFFENYDECAAAMRAALAEHPVFAAHFAAADAQQLAAAAALTRQRVEQAFDGDWETYAQKLRMDGGGYASLGISFTDWFSLGAAWTNPVVPILIARFGAEPERLTSALAVLQLFRDRALAVIGEAFIDASEREIRARALELRRWEAVFEGIGWGICITDSTGSALAQCNAAFLRMYGFEKHDPTRTLESLFDSDDQVRVWREVGPLAQETGFASYEAIHRRVDGTTFPVQAEAVRIPDLDNQPTWVISVHDLTERRQVEVLRARSTELETENHHVQETSRLKSEFLANMSHELRTPLNSILGFSELLHNGEVGALSEQQRDFVGDIHTSGKHLLRLINDILDLSKVEAGKLDFYPEETTLTAVAGEVVAVLRGVAHAAAVHVDVTIEPAIDAVYLDTSRLKQVLYNYISNAIKFTPAGGRVRVMAHRENATCFRLEVADDGPGISPENLSRLFTEFEQLDAGRTKSHGGTGLGLALTRRLVEAQRGSVGVDSVEGKGCVFFAVLPVRSSFPSLLPQPSRIAGSKSDAPRILVVEDDAADQMQIVTLLLAAGYAVDTAATAAHALQSMQEWTYDAITLDLLLPDGNGFEILRAVRRRPGYEHVPVIVISMVASQVTAAFAVQEVLQKPLNDADLVAALARTSVWPPGPVLVVDDDDASARLMTSSLAQIGLEVAVANNGIDGLQRALERTPSAVILDLVMPGMDGFGFLREFRRRAEWTHVPVLIWTTKDLTADERTRLLQSANGVLAKDGAGGVALLDAIREHLPHVRRVR